MKWIKTTEKLPLEGKYVLARHNRGTWIDSTDQKNVNCVVVKLCIGISQKERLKMGDCERSRTITGSDEHGNNEVAYSWSSFGADSFFGQSITHWADIGDVK
jgi:hypothetical protein